MALGYANEGKWLVIADGPHVRALDADAGDVVHSFKAQPYHINSMALAGDKVVVTGGDKVSHLWDVKEAKKLLTFPSQPDRGLALTDRGTGSPTEAQTPSLR